MNAKILAVLGVMALAVATWFFYQEDVEIKPATPSAPDVSFEVTGIKATQTNPETGQIEYTLTAESLVQRDGQEYMHNAQMDWQPPTGERFHIQANYLSLNQQTGEMTITQGFTFGRKNKDDDPKHELLIRGESLAGNTKTKIITSEQAVSITQANNSFDAQSFVANLQDGEYEFRQIAIQFDPPKRTDAPLFSH